VQYRSERNLFGESTPSFNRDRIKQARELAGLTQNELAEKIDVQQAWIAKIESGRKAPSRELMAKISQATDQPLSFFAQDSILELGDGTLLFRAKADISRKKEIEARRHAEIVLEMLLRFAERFDQIPVAIAPVHDRPAAAAQEVRQQLGLDATKPVPHLLRSVEKAGGIVLGIPALKDRDAFAIWVGSGAALPIIAIAEGTSPDRVRLSAAHELGHLVLHKRASVASRTLEIEAYAFAAELLAPEQGIRPELEAEKITLERLGQLKLRWGMSMQALLRRASELSVINERQYRYLIQQLGIRGWRLHEPTQFDIPLEKPRLLCQMAEHIYGKPLDYSRIAGDVYLTSQAVQSILSRYASTAEATVQDVPSNVVRFPYAASR